VVKAQAERLTWRVTCRLDGPKSQVKACRLVGQQTELRRLERRNKTPRRLRSLLAGVGMGTDRWWRE